MYWEHFGFSEPPFSLTPNPDFLFLSSHHQEAFAHLLYAIDTRAGFIELSGEVGTGKTTIIRTLLNQLDPATHRTALIFNPTLSPLGLLQEINREFGLPCTSCETRELHQSLNEFLLEENRVDRTVVLVIDEAQNLAPSVLEQVRLISNLETERAKLIQIVLVGQPELKSLLGRQELRQLNQRITVRYHLRPMAFSDVHEYIRHRIRVAADGREPITFAAGSIKKIYRFSGGLPRLINAVCDRALLLAYTTERREISPAMAQQAIADINKDEPRARFRLVPVGLALACIAILAIAGTIFVSQQQIVTNKELPAVTPLQSTASSADREQQTSVNGVKVLQELLKETGHYNGPLDGLFSTTTESAVRSFQQAQGLQVDGKPGGKTLSRLYQAAGGSFPANGTAATRQDSIPPSVPAPPKKQGTEASR
ncbi:MAG: AAA family ATPase [Geobacter sp.]|nr:AAA family ATPase [Geobacter sp.]